MTTHMTFELVLVESPKAAKGSGANDNGNKTEGNKA